MLQLRKAKEDEVFKAKQDARQRMVETQAANLAQLMSDEDERVDKQVQAKEDSDERLRLEKELLHKRWIEDIENSRNAQIERRRRTREREKAEDLETAKFVGEWCRVLDHQEMEELEVKKLANRRLAEEHRKAVEVKKSRGGEERKEDIVMAMHARKALEADTAEFH